MTSTRNVWDLWLLYLANSRIFIRYGLMSAFDHNFTDVRTLSVKMSVKMETERDVCTVLVVLYL